MVTDLMANYVDGYVFAIAKSKIAAYKRIATKAARIWKKHGALEYRECIGDDMNVTMLVPFPKLLALKKGETAGYAWIVFKSRAHRDRVNHKVMTDPAMLAMCAPEAMPIDCKRMVYGGFKVLVES